MWDILIKSAVMLLMGLSLFCFSQVPFLMLALPADAAWVGEPGKATVTIGPAVETANGHVREVILHNPTGRPLTYVGSHNGDPDYLLGFQNANGGWVDDCCRIDGMGLSTHTLPAGSHVRSYLRVSHYEGNNWRRNITLTDSYHGAPRSVVRSKGVNDR